MIVLKVHLDGMRESIEQAMLLHQEQIQHILETKLKEVLSVEAFMNRFRVEIEDAIDKSIEEFFSDTGEGYSIISETIKKSLLKLLQEKLK
jgi:uncharacterized protein YjcR